MKSILLIGIFCFSFFHTKAQGFHFGANLAGISSQVEGDKLRGFNDFGYSFGLVGGYTFNETHYLIVSPQYSFFGSNRKGERFSNEVNQIFIEMDLSSVNVLCGYSYRFGDTWTGDKKYRLNAGLRTHRLIRAKTHIAKTASVGDVTIDKEDDLKKFFLTLDLSAGINFTPHLGLELGYNHSLHNLLKNQKYTITKLAPFYLSLGLSYYFF